MPQISFWENFKTRIYLKVYMLIKDSNNLHTLSFIFVCCRHTCKCNQVNVRCSLLTCMYGIIIYIVQFYHKNIRISLLAITLVGRNVSAFQSYFKVVLLLCILSTSFNSLFTWNLGHMWCGSAFVSFMYLLLKREKNVWSHCFKLHHKTMQSLLFSS